MNSMSHDELVAEMNRLKEQVAGDKKDHWDKAAVIGTVAGAVLVPVVLAMAGFYFSGVLSKQQINSSLQIASDNLRLGQYQLAAGLMKSLSSPDARERKQAISFVFVVFPESEARRFVNLLSQSDPDFAVRTSATNALSARLAELTTDVVGSDPQKSQLAASQLTNAWQTDPMFTKSLLDAADRHQANPRAQADTANLLNTLDARTLRPHSNEVSKLIRRIPADNPQFQQNVLMLNQKLQSRE
ncbi:MAG: hypothetical protein ACYDH9_19125 [Limisphaerales bacterium]